MEHAEDRHPTVEVRLGGGAAGDAAGGAVRALALQAGVGGERATRLRAVVEELLVEAAARECVGGADELVVRVSAGPDRLEVEVADHRLPLDPGAGRHLASRRLAALGFVDRLHVAAHGAEGNLATCRVALSAAEAGPFDVEVLDAEVPRASDEQAEALVVRPMTDGDAAGVARCVYRCYGYSYLDPSMYRPRSLRAALHAGLMHSVVAVTPDGEVVGHCALSLERSGDPVPEGGKLVVDPRYRGHHLSDRLAQRRLELAHELGLCGVWFECVTNHPYSQREVLSSGGVETGLLVGATPASITMQGLENTRGGRHSLLTMWLPVGPCEPSTLHVSARHHDVVDQLVQRTGLDRRIEAHEGPSIDESSPGHSQLSSSAGADTGVGHVRVAAIGADLLDRVADVLDGFAAFDLAVVQLDLPLTDPAAGAATELLERQGFSFGAWMPAFGAEGDVLRLQRVGERPLELDHIECARSEGEQLRDLVLAEWRRVGHGG